MLSLAAAKAHLRVTSDHEDDLIRRLVEAARAHLEDRTSLYLGDPTERTVYQPGSGTSTLYLRNPPQGAVTVTEHVVPGDEGTELDAEDFRVDGRKLQRLGGYVWSDCREYAITCPVGYTGGDAYSDAPPGLVQAQAMLVAHWFENREAAAVGTISAEIVHGVENLIAPYIPLPI